MDDGGCRGSGFGGGDHDGWRGPSRDPAENRSRVLGAPRVQWIAGNGSAISPDSQSLLVAVLPTLLATSVSFAVAVDSSGRRRRRAANTAATQLLPLAALALAVTSGRAAPVCLLLHSYYSAALHS